VINQQNKSSKLKAFIKIPHVLQYIHQKLAAASAHWLMAAETSSIIKTAFFNPK
jgi:hypothetical protein